MVKRAFKKCNLKRIFQFLMNMAFISSSEVEHIYITRVNEIHTFFTSRVK